MNWRAGKYGADGVLEDHEPETVGCDHGYCLFYFFERALKR